MITRTNIILDVMPDEEFIKQSNYFRRRNAKYTAIGVAMYIIGAAFLIGLGGLGIFLGNQYLYGVVGLISLLIISVVATGIIIYTNLLTPLEYKDYNAATKKGFESLDSKHSRLLDSMIAIYWIMITVVYLAISFTTMRWDIIG